MIHHQALTALGWIFLGTQKCGFKVFFQVALFAFDPSFKQWDFFSLSNFTLPL